MNSLLRCVATDQVYRSACFILADVRVLVMLGLWLRAVARMAGCHARAFPRSPHLRTEIFYIACMRVLNSHAQIHLL